MSHVQVGVDFLRLGPAHRVHPSLLSHTPPHSLTPPCTVSQLEQLYHSKVRHNSEAGREECRGGGGAGQCLLYYMYAQQLRGGGGGEG